jgi:DNA-directed RNA polymerase specialized sigma24 family protein
MKPNELTPNVEPIPEEGRLVGRAKSGEIDAFIELYDVYSDDLYRYIYFRVLSDVAAEAITSQVFRHAWDHLRAYRKKRSSFVGWIYDIARTQVIVYYKVNLKTDAFDIRMLLAAPDYRLNQEAQDWSPGEAWGNHLQLLTGDIEQSRLQTTAALVMREYLDYLNPRRSRKPSPTFNAYTRAWLIRYVHLHQRQPAPSPVRVRVRSASTRLVRTIQALEPRLTLAPAARRMSLAYAVLIVALLITGTAKAQAALPGEPLYGWKRTSEQVWLSVSPDPVGTDIVLADRRFNELLAVEHDPKRSQSALHDYMQSITSLNLTGNAQSRARFLPLLEAHQKKLKDSGLASQPLYTYLAVAAKSTSSATAPTVAVAATAVAASPTLPPSPTARPTQVPPTATARPTQVPPTATTVPTEIPPTATVAPTEVPPTPTEIPTEIPPTPTEVPTEVIPTATEVPTIIVPTSTAVPTEALPSATEPPATPTPIPMDTPVVGDAISPPPN